MSRPVLRVRPIDLPLSRPFVTARGPRTHAHNVLVEIEYEGVTGRGEGVPHPRYGQSQESAARALRELAVPSASPFEQEAWLEPLRAAHPGELAAQCALESALWDWAGLRTGRRLVDLLGLREDRLPPSSWTVSIDRSEEFEQRIAEARDWPVLKVKLGGGDADYGAIERLRRGTSQPFRVDANESWSVEEAIEKSHFLAVEGCELIEQPLPAGRLEETARVREASPLPIVADEDCVPPRRPADLASAYDGVNLKLSRLGGLRACVHWAAAARDLGLDLMIGCFVESSLGIGAAAPLAAMARWVDLDGAALLAHDPWSGARVDASGIHLSSRPGIGVGPADAG